MSPPGQRPAPSPSRSFFERAIPLTLIYTSFALIFLPMLALQLSGQHAPLFEQLALAHGVGLGLTHFLVTFAIYLQAENRDHFRCSWRNRAIYVAAPLTILLTFGLAALLDMRERVPTCTAVVLIAVRFFDFFHVGRQTFGVLQLFKLPFGHRDAAFRRDENRFFVGLALLQWMTFTTGGRFPARAPYAALLAALLGGLFVSLSATYVSVARTEGTARGPLSRAYAYFCMQAFAGACAVYDTRLYLIALTLHYVEYHVLMAPRCLQTRLDRTRWPDRIGAALRSHPLVFYGALLALALLLNGVGAATGDRAASTNALVHLFDGVFLAHYFLEAFLWRLHEPFYRAQLTPLYALDTQSAGAPRETRTQSASPHLAAAEMAHDRGKP